MAELRELGRRLIERPPVPVTPTGELKRRWRRRKIRRGAPAAVVVIAAVALFLTVATQEDTTTSVQMVSPPSVSPPSVSPQSVSPGSVSPPSSVSLPPGKTGQVNPTPASSALDLSWTNAEDGWVLSSHPCAQGLCPGLEHTSDGGAHWASLPDPPAVVQSSSTLCFTSTTKCVSDVAFATPSIGYLYGPALFVTIDGGLTWHRQAGLMVQTMAIDGTRALRVSYTGVGCPGPCQSTLQAAPVGSDTWHTLVKPTNLSDVGSQILSSGNDIFLALYGNLAQGAQPATIYRSLDGGNSWSTLADPCVAAAHLSVLTQLAATNSGTLDGLCWSARSNTTLSIVSHSDGSRWDAPQLIPGGSGVGLIAAAGPTTIAVATPDVGGSGPFTAELLVSTDSGHHWTAAVKRSYELHLYAALPAWLGFETPEVGRWVSGPNDIWTTSNGGRSWVRSVLP